MSFEDSQFRKALADSALGSMRLEGLEPPPDAEAIVQRFVDGELSAEELRDAIDEQLSKRPIHVS